MNLFSSTPYIFKIRKFNNGMGKITCCRHVTIHFFYFSTLIGISFSDGSGGVSIKSALQSIFSVLIFNNQGDQWVVSSCLIISNSTQLFCQFLNQKASKHRLKKDFNSNIKFDKKISHVFGFHCYYSRYIKRLLTQLELLLIPNTRKSVQFEMN